MVEIFKTNVKNIEVADQCITILNEQCPSYKANFDLMDIDNILRIKSEQEIEIDIPNILQIVKSLGIEIELINDEINQPTPIQEIESARSRNT